MKSWFMQSQYEQLKMGENVFINMQFVLTHFEPI